MLIEKGQDIRNNFNDIRNNAKKLIEEEILEIILMILEIMQKNL